MNLMKPKLLMLLSVIIFMVLLSVTAYAANNELLTVNKAWIDGEMIRIDVTDANGVKSELALHLADYVNKNDTGNEYISIQATDAAGNKSDVIQIKNPYYKPSADNVIIANIPSSENTVSAVPNGNPFTPDGSGTVVDNVKDSDGKEFFTVKTEDGSIFYLIIDRQRNANNVYFLNVVTEEDLISLAQKNGKSIQNGSTSSISSAEQPMTNGQTPNNEPKSKPEKPPSDGINMTYIIIGIAVIVVGGAGYYFKIVKGKKKTSDTDDDDLETDDEPEEIDDDNFDENEPEQEDDE